MTTDFQLHAAAEGDAVFLFEAYEATLRPYVEWAWGWDDAFQKQGFKTHHPIQEWRVVSVGGQPAGGLHVQESAASHFVRMVFLLPPFQGKGIGTLLLQQEVRRAERHGKFLELKVVKINPAKALYERLGLTLVGEDAATFHLRTPAAI